MKIGKYSENNPSAKMTEIALHFECTYNQVVHALKLYKAGKLHRNKPRVEKSNVEALIAEKSPETMLDNQFHRAVAQLESEPDTPTDERITLLEKLVNMRKRFQTMQLENYLRRADSAIISIIIRKFLPAATDDDVIMIYKEAYEIWKNQ